MTALANLPQLYPWIFLLNWIFVNSRRLQFVSFFVEVIVIVEAPSHFSARDRDRRKTTTTAAATPRSFRIISQCDRMGNFSKHFGLVFLQKWSKISCNFRRCFEKHYFSRKKLLLLLFGNFGKNLAASYFKSHWWTLLSLFWMEIYKFLPKLIPKGYKTLPIPINCNQLLPSTLFEMFHDA